LPQTQGREAAITFCKSASGAGKLLLSGRRVGSTRRCDQSAWSEAAEGGTITDVDKVFCGRRRQHGCCRLAD